MEKEKQFITEDDGLQDDWYQQATRMTLEELPEFLKKLTSDYSHDMNTICHAVTAGALATIVSMNRTPEGGLGKAQQQKVLSLFVGRWLRINGPFKIITWMGALHPSTEPLYTCFPKSVFPMLVEEAKRLLEESKNEPDNDPAIVAHLQSIAEGNVPFGMKLSEVE